MFTGIIQEIGSVVKASRSGSILKLDIATKNVGEDASIGDSISVNGVCLTVTEKAKKRISFEAIAKTVQKTTLCALKSGSTVNLEGALKAGDPISGHFVQGHVDNVSKIVRLERKADTFAIGIEVPAAFADLVVEKGSITIDGVSLTVGALNSNICTIFVIPHTLKATTLGDRKVGDPVNVEFDILGKYIVRTTRSRISGVSESHLKQHGFTL